MPDWSFSVCDIQDHFEYNITKHETIADNPPVEVYMKLRSSKKDIDQNKHAKIEPKLETVEVNCWRYLPEPK